MGKLSYRPSKFYINSNQKCTGVTSTHNSEGLTPALQKLMKQAWIRTQAFGSRQESPCEYLELVLRARCGPQCVNNRLIDPWTNIYAHAVQHTQTCALETDPHRILT